MASAGGRRGGCGDLGQVEEEGGPLGPGRVRRAPVDPPSPRPFPVRSASCTTPSSSPPPVNVATSRLRCSSPSCCIGRPSAASKTWSKKRPWPRGYQYPNNLEILETGYPFCAAANMPCAAAGGGKHAAQRSRSGKSRRAQGKTHRAQGKTHRAWRRNRPRAKANMTPARRVRRQNIAGLRPTDTAAQTKITTTDRIESPEEEVGPYRWHICARHTLP